ncbi:MAG: glycerate kinase [Sulfobacillus benefaciens]|uniref:Glycerate kinase n=1 Tax=Sulfobacillus benefaciens TaxID=453960 RepID=A0A2T2XLK1_9FIRM|nr:MAG: glycerate kinase [Sulfobacillus benefaciens]
MQILIAPDSFKGSLSAQAVATGLARGLSHVLPENSVRIQPMADGGEGTGAVVEHLGGRRVFSPTVTIYGQPTEGYWIRWERVAVVEAAVGSGFVPPESRQFSGEHTTSLGTGLLIAHALADPGIDRVIVALGGTGSTDGGMGLLAALGARFEDSHGQILEPFGDNLGKVAKYSAPHLTKPLMGIYDVQVPLLGPRGAVAQFGIQKGIAPPNVDRVNAEMAHYAHRIQSQLNEHWIENLGAGSAGGMGFGILAAGGCLEPGAETIAHWCKLDEQIQTADWIVTGEGRIDRQTLEGKVVGTIVRHAEQYHKPVVAVVGSRTDDLHELHLAGLTLVMPLATGPMTLQEEMANAPQLLSLLGEELGWLLKTLDH